MPSAFARCLCAKSVTSTDENPNKVATKPKIATFCTSLRSGISGTSHLYLTGSAPDLISDSTSGLTHSWKVSTRYYTATLPIWVDEIPDVKAWHDEFSSPEAKEVVSVLGAWIFCFKKPIKQADVDHVQEALKAISNTIERACGFSGDAVCLAVAMPQSMTPHLEKSGEEWDELCMEHGFEYIDSEAKGKNEFGEALGLQRVEDALKAQEWEGDDIEFGFDGDDEFGGSFDAEEAEMGMELFGMKAALSGVEDEGEAQVEELERMMRRMIAIKETGEGMPEAERKRFAAKAVNELMKEL